MLHKPTQEADLLDLPACSSSVTPDVPATSPEVLFYPRS